jgi:hypothetical protein
MKKITNRSNRTRPVKQLGMESLKKVTGGGLSGPDICDGRYKIICIQDVTPPGNQDC